MIHFYKRDIFVTPYYLKKLLKTLQKKFKSLSIHKD